MATQLKVLCVDDHQETAECNGSLLAGAGCEVRICHDGNQALRVAREFHPDVCVIDLTMPGMGGEELIARLREQEGGRAIRCIALTGHWDIDTQHRTNNAGFKEHLVKPAEPDRLIEAVLGREACASG